MDRQDQMLIHSPFIAEVYTNLAWNYDVVLFSLLQPEQVGCNTRYAHVVE